MRTSSIAGKVFSQAALLLALLHAPVAGARTLSVSMDRLTHPQASMGDVSLSVSDAGQLHLGAARLSVPQLDLAGRVDWQCNMVTAADGARSCAGPLRLSEGHGEGTVADLSVRATADNIALTFARDGSEVSVELPFASDSAYDVTLQNVPAAWLKRPLAFAWRGGEIRSGALDGDARIGRDGSFDANFRTAGLVINTADGSVAGNALNATGHVSWSSAVPASRVTGNVELAGGTLAVGALRIALPASPVSASIDASVDGDGRLAVEHFTWRDPDVLDVEGSGSFLPSAVAPLEALALTITKARFPVVIERYASALWQAKGLDAIALKGDLGGEIVTGTAGPQRIALSSAAFDIDDRLHGVAVGGIHGGIDWTLRGSRPVTRLGWTSLQSGDVVVGAASARWQSREGALALIGTLQTRVFGGTARLRDLIVHPLAGEGERLRSAFAIDGLGYDSADGATGVAALRADGTFNVQSVNGTLRSRIDARLLGGEVLAGPLYVKLPTTPIAASVTADHRADGIHIAALDWHDLGTLDLSATGDIALSADKPVSSLSIDLRQATLDRAIERYARSWLAARGYAELVGAGSVSGSLHVDADGVHDFRFEAHDVSLHDGAGRFAFDGIDGGVDWLMDGDRPSTRFGWRSMEWFRIPLGAAQGAFETRQGDMVLAAPMAVDVLGGQVRLEKLSLQPRSPRGERYAASFSIAGVEMAQVSAALGWPRFGGNLAGGIPEIVFAGDTIELHGGLDLYLFDGYLGISGMSLERPFGVAPALRANIHFHNFDLAQVTDAFSFGGMSGRLDGSIDDLRLVDWSTVGFDARLQSKAGGRMSYKAVNDLTSIGGGGLGENLQSLALKIVDTFGYGRLGLRCRLAERVCTMGGLDEVAEAAPKPANDSYTIVEGSGIPRISIVGHRRRVDWPTLVERVQQATHGQAPIIK